MGIIEAIDAIDIQSVAWIFMLAIGWYVYKKKDQK